MPQIDIITYSSTSYWLTIIYFCYYFGSMLNSFPKLSNFLKLFEYRILFSTFYCSNLQLSKCDNFLKIFSLKIQELVLI